MVKNMKNYNLLKDKIEKIFKELKISYEYVDFDDNDINYIISFNTYGRLKSLNSIRGILYLHHADFSLNLVVPNIYTLSDSDESLDTLDLYEITNDLNSELLYGGFFIEDNKNIFYKSSLNCNNEYIGLNDKILMRQINIFVNGLEKLFTIIKKHGLR